MALRATYFLSVIYGDPVVLVHMLLGNNSEHIFRAEADIPLEPTTSGRKIKSILGVICPSW